MRNSARRRQISPASSAAVRDIAAERGTEPFDTLVDIVLNDELRTILARERRGGRTIAFTNGCFDLIHAGHLQLLNFAPWRELGLP